MRRNSKARFVPIFVLLAVMPAIWLPIVLTLHLPDYVIGGLAGFFIGLALVGLVWIAKSNPKGSTGDRSS